MAASVFAAGFLSDSVVASAGPVRGGGDAGRLVLLFADKKLLIVVLDLGSLVPDDLPGLVHGALQGGPQLASA